MKILLEVLCEVGKGELSKDGENMKRKDIQRAVKYLEKDCSWSVLGGLKFSTKDKGVADFIRACKIACGEKMK